MAMLGLDGIKKYASADVVDGDKDDVLTKNRERFLDNSKRTFVWNQVSRWSSMVFGGVISGLSIAVASQLFGRTGGAAAIAGTFGSAGLIGVVAVSAIVGIGAAYVAHQIQSSNSLNANEINSRQTGKYIKAALENGKSQETEQSEAAYHNVVMDDPSERQSHVLFDKPQDADFPQHKIQTSDHDVSKALPIALEIEPLSSVRH